MYLTYINKASVPLSCAVSFYLSSLENLGVFNDLLVVVDLLGVAQVRIVEGGSIAVLASRGGLLSGSVNRLAHDVGGLTLPIDLGV